MCVVRIFLRLVLIEVVFLRPRKVLKMLLILFRLSSFLIERIFFLDHLAVFFVVACLHLVLCCVSVRVVEVIRRGRCS